MRTSAPIWAVVAIALLAPPARPQDRAAESERKVKELRKERISVLKELVDHLGQSFRDGRAPYDEVLEARRLLLEAELEVAETDAERFDHLKNLVALARQFEEYADSRMKAGRGNLASVHKATARRLEAEIRLERVRPKVVPPEAVVPPGAVVPRPPDMVPPRPPGSRSRAG